MKLNYKYLVAENYEVAEEAAIEYFCCEKTELTIEIVSGNADSLFWIIFAMKGTPEQHMNMNGCFKLYYEEEGVFLELYEARGVGMPIDRGELSLYIKRKNISKIDAQTTLSLTTKGKGREKIAPPQEEFFYGEFLNVDISPNDLEATACMLSPEPGGSFITLEEAEQLVRAAGVVHGYEPEILENIIKTRDYGTTHVIAKATAPVNGENGRIEYHFNTEKKDARPSIKEDGKADYKDLALFEAVTEGQLLVSKVLPTEGTPGKTVTGNDIKQKPGKDVSLPKSKNTKISDDRYKIFSALTGLVELVNGTVMVTNVYKVEGDCGMSVGNIDFDGSVHITGNVISGHVIKATGSVIIGGVVEASEIYAGGSVEVKRGMQGMDRGRIEAGGSITILYIERGVAIAGESVIVDASIHSTIEAGQSVIAKGKRGSIIGGSVRAADEINANSIGSISHAQTEVEVGLMPQKRARIDFLESELKRLNAEMEKLEKLDSYLQKGKDRMDPEAWDKLNVSAAVSKRENNRQLAECESELAELNKEAENSINGKVHVFKTAYPNVKITIGQSNYRVNNEQSFSTFKFRDGEIIFLPCELSKK